MDPFVLLQSIHLDSTTIFWSIGVVFVIAIIVGISLIMTKSSLTSTPSNIERIGNVRLPELDALLSPYFKPKETLSKLPLSAAQKALVNFAPLTVFNPGYIGPTDNGVYKEAEGVAQALKAGARCFVLPIDYQENDNLPRTAFPPAGDPCLLYRDAGGVIRSLNAGSIEKIAQTLANLAFNDTIPSKSDPLLVILYFVRTPQELTKEYLRYCSKVAKELQPLRQYFLGQAPEGVYNRQARQDELLYTDLTNLERKAILLCNIDTSLFRNPKSVGVPSVSNQEDLDFLVHLRLFSPIDPPLGATQKASQNVFPRGYITTLEYSTTIPDTKAKETIETNRIRWIVNLASDIPQSKDVTYVTEKLGVQCVALPFYALTDANKAVLELWKKGWIVKPDPLRFTRPQPIQPKDPSPKLNANQGRVSSPTI